MLYSFTMSHCAPVFTAKIKEGGGKCMRELMKAVRSTLTVHILGLGSISFFVIAMAVGSY